MVYAGDLKSPGHQPCRFESGLRHTGMGMDPKLKIAASRLLEASRLGLAAHREEIEIVVSALEKSQDELGRKTREFHSLKTAFDILEGVVTDQGSRIQALEKAISDYLDPNRARDGDMELRTILEKELGRE